MNKMKKRRKLYMPTSFTIIFMLMLVFIVMSWILQASNVTTIKGEEVVAITGLGLLDTLTSIWYGFKDKAEIILFIFCVGGMLAIMNRTKAIDAGIESLVKKLNGKEILLIPALMIIFGLGGTTYGMWEETIAFFPILIPVFIKVGFGPFAAVLTILLGAGVGTMASTVNPFAVGVAVAEMKGFNQGIMLGSRALTWAILMPIAIAFVMHIALKTKKGQYSLEGIDEKAIKNKFSIKQEKIHFNFKRKLTVTVFILGFLLMILAYLPWYDWVGAEALGKWTAFADKNIFWIARSSMWEGGWGNWYFISVSGVFLLVSLIIFAINHDDFVEKDSNKENTFINTFADGAKDVLSVCLLIAVAAGLGKILETSNIGIWIANSSSALGDVGLVGFTLVIFGLSIILSFFVPSTSGFAAAFIPVFVAVGLKAFPNSLNAAYGLIIMAFILASGIVNLVSPTSAALMAYTNYSKIPYPFWLKKVGPLIIMLFAVSIILLIAVASMATKGIIF